ncbi:hypothetical protein MSG71_09020 [Acinetobacter baumannii]|uniref:hypothetical protein n=1 Tax=Acinetobacter baumannii TaxID=470 RepID=UPI00294103A3|nr:hypothetical protein [Acinetobacter baumannii]MDV4274741.1 hypothetical protein [Acinetobacter baumannii]
MDKCREEFEKWLDDNNMFMNIERRFDQESNTYDYCAIRWIWESWQHQQAKVEELKASHHGEVIGHEVHFKKIKQERDELQTLYTQQGINMLKMQKRVDVLTQTMEEVLEEMKYPTATFEEVIVCGVKVLEQALKGEKE